MDRRIERTRAAVVEAAVELVARRGSQVGMTEIAQAAGVSTLVLSHFVPGDDASITDEMWAEGVRKHYGGRIVVGADLMEI